MRVKCREFKSGEVEANFHPSFPVLTKEGKSQEADYFSGSPKPCKSRRDERFNGRRNLKAMGGCRNFDEARMIR